MKKIMKTITISKDSWLELKHLQLRLDCNSLDNLVKLMAKIVLQVKGWDEYQTNHNTKRGGK